MVDVTNAAVISLLPVSYSLLYSNQPRHHQSFPIYITQNKIADKKKKKKDIFPAKRPKQKPTSQPKETPQNDSVHAPMGKVWFSPLPLPVINRQTKFARHLSFLLATPVETKTLAVTTTTSALNVNFW